MPLQGKAEYPSYRTIFSAAAAGITMLATGAVYMVLGGTTPPTAGLAVAKPLVGAIGTYFLVNTSFVGDRAVIEPHLRRDMGA